MATEVVGSKMSANPDPKARRGMRDAGGFGNNFDDTPSNINNKSQESGKSGFLPEVTLPAEGANPSRVLGDTGKVGVHSGMSLAPGNKMPDAGATLGVGRPVTTRK